MKEILILLITLFVLALLAFFVLASKGKKHETDYKTFFLLGAVWLPIGIATDSSLFTIIGLIFLITGITNKDKWKKKK